MVNLANLSKSCFLPTCSNSTPIFRLSPSPDISVTIPDPNLSCRIRAPTSNPVIETDPPDTDEVFTASNRFKRGEYDLRGKSCFLEGKTGSSRLKKDEREELYMPNEREEKL